MVAEEAPAEATSSPSSEPLTSSFEPGTGHLHLSAGPRASPSTLLGSYPLKLLAPNPLPSQPSHVALVYTLAYGGGLVAGDCVQLRVVIDPGCTLVLLTQGSTKVYKQRPGLRPKSHGMSPALKRSIINGQSTPTVRQRMHVSVEKGGSLLLLPDSLSPFRGSRYAQAQRVELAEGAGAVILDWVNSGRGERVTRAAPRPWNERAKASPVEQQDHSKSNCHSVGNDKKSDKTTPNETAASQNLDSSAGETRDTEVWAMEYYSSTNEILVGGKVVARERMVLDNGHLNSTGWSATAMKLAPYHVYATVMIHGAPFQSLRTYLETLVDQTSQFQLPLPPGLLWSYSPTAEDGGLLRVAGVEVEDVRKWLREVFEHGGLADMVGPGLWPRCI